MLRRIRFEITVRPCALVCVAALAPLDRMLLDRLSRSGLALPDSLPAYVDMRPTRPTPRDP